MYFCSSSQYQQSRSGKLKRPKRFYSFHKAGSVAGIKALICLLLICTLAGCKENSAQVSFYYWRTVYDPSDEVTEQLRELNVKRMYIRYFDVVKDPNGNGIPEAVIRFQKTPAFEVVPVVFIKSDVFVATTDIDKLSQNVYGLIKSVSKQHAINFSEVQIDCDWNESSRLKYFEFLDALKKKAGCMLSVTIRLHQVKYHNITGIPPCDKGILMFYNMGELSGDDDYMFSEKRSLPYLSYLQSYPLPLEPALPFYEQAIAYRNGKPFEIYKPALINENIHLFSRDGDRYIADSSFFSNGEYIRKGDIFKIETSRNHIVLKAAKLLRKSLSYTSGHVIFYDVPDEKQSDEVITTIKKAGSLFN